MSTFLNQYGPWALITGASSGLGAEFAKQLAKQKLNLVLVARRVDRLQALGESLKQAEGIKYRAVEIDLAQENFLYALQVQTADLDIGLLINNAGFTNTGNLLDQAIEDELRLLHVNCRAPLILTHHFAQSMRKRQRGGIIFSSSVAGFMPLPTWSNYAASKAYDLFLAEALAVELRKDHVDVLALCPGIVDTEFAHYQGPMTSLILTPQKVVQQALKKLGRTDTTVVGINNQLNVFLTRFVPRRWMTVVAGMITRSMVGK